MAVALPTREVAQVDVGRPHDPMDLTLGMTAVFANEVTDRFECTTANGRYDGYGSVIFKSSNHYLGDVSQGRLHGHGVYTWKDSVQYKGDFDGNMISGEGHYTWADGSEYRGQVRAGKRHGRGIFTKGNSRYDGEWKEGVRHGLGVLFFNAERTHYYEGEFVDGKKHGWGRMRYKSGSVYEGQWVDGRMEGYGVMRWVIPGAAMAAGTGMATTAVQKPSAHMRTPGNTPLVKPLALEAPGAGRKGGKTTVSVKSPTVGAEGRPEARSLLGTAAAGLMGAPVSVLKQSSALATATRPLPGVQDAAAPLDAERPFGGAISFQGAAAPGGFAEALARDRTQPHDDDANVTGRIEIYEGEWADGKPHGVGSYTWRCKTRPKAAPSGEGTASTARNDPALVRQASGPAATTDVGASIAGLETPLQGENVYKGFFEAGMRDGCGVLMLADGTMFEGTWEANVKNGIGLFTQADGSIDILKIARDTIVAKKQLRSRQGVLNGALFDAVPAAAAAQDPFGFLRRGADQTPVVGALSNEDNATVHGAAAWRAGERASTKPARSRASKAPGAASPSAASPGEPLSGAATPVVPLALHPIQNPPRKSAPPHDSPVLSARSRDSHEPLSPPALPLTDSKALAGHIDFLDLIDGPEKAARRMNDRLKSYLTRHLPELRFLYRFYAMMGPAVALPTPADRARDAARLEGLSTVLKQRDAYERRGVAMEAAGGVVRRAKSASSACGMADAVEVASSIEELTVVHDSAEARAFRKDAEWLSRFDVALPRGRTVTRREGIFFKLHQAVGIVCREAGAAAARTHRQQPAATKLRQRVSLGEHGACPRVLDGDDRTAPPVGDTGSHATSPPRPDSSGAGRSLPVTPTPSMSARRGSIGAGIARRAHGSGRFSRARSSRSRGGGDVTPTPSRVSDAPSGSPTPRPREAVEVIAGGGAGSMARRESIRIVADPRATRAAVEALCEEAIPYASISSPAGSPVSESPNPSPRSSPRQGGRGSRSGSTTLDMLKQYSVPFSSVEEQPPVQAQWEMTPVQVAPTPTTPILAVASRTGSFGGSLMFGGGHTGPGALGISEKDIVPAVDEAATTLHLAQFWTMLRDLGIADAHMPLHYCDAVIAPVLAGQQRDDAFTGMDLQMELVGAYPLSAQGLGGRSERGDLETVRSGVAAVDRQKFPGRTPHAYRAPSKSNAGLPSEGDKAQGAAAGALPAERQGSMRAGNLGNSGRRGKVEAEGSNLPSISAAAPPSAVGSVYGISKVHAKRKSLPSTRPRMGDGTKSAGALSELLHPQPEKSCREKLDNKTTARPLRDPHDPQMPVLFWVWVRCLVRLCDVKLCTAPPANLPTGRRELTLVERVNCVFRSCIDPVVEALRLVGRSQVGNALCLPALARGVEGNLSHLNRGQPFTVPGSAPPGTVSPGPTVSPLSNFHSLAALTVSAVKGSGPPKRGSMHEHTRPRGSLVGQAARTRGSLAVADGADADAEGDTPAPVRSPLLRGGVAAVVAHARADASAGENARTPPTKILPYEAGVKEARAILKWLEQEQQKHRDTRAITLASMGTGVTAHGDTNAVAMLQAITITDVVDASSPVTKSPLRFGGGFAPMATTSSVGATMTPPEPIAAVVLSETYFPPAGRRGGDAGAPPCICLGVETEAGKEADRRWRAKCLRAVQVRDEAVATLTTVDAADVMTQASSSVLPSPHRESLLDMTATSSVAGIAAKYAVGYASDSSVEPYGMTAQRAREVLRAIPVPPVLFPRHFHALMRSRPVVEALADGAATLHAVYHDYCVDGTLHLRDVVRLFRDYRIAGVAAGPSNRKRNAQRIHQILAGSESPPGTGGHDTLSFPSDASAEHNAMRVEGGLRARLSPEGPADGNPEPKSPLSLMTPRTEGRRSSGAVPSAPTTPAPMPAKEPAPLTALSPDGVAITHYAKKVQAARRAGELAEAGLTGALPDFLCGHVEWVLRPAVWYALGLDVDAAFSVGHHQAVALPEEEEADGFMAFEDVEKRQAQAANGQRGAGGFGTAGLRGTLGSRLPQLQSVASGHMDHLTSHAGSRQSRVSGGGSSTPSVRNEATGRLGRSFHSFRSTQKAEEQPPDCADPTTIDDLVARDRILYDPSWVAPAPHVAEGIAQHWLARASATPLLYHEFVDILVVAACVCFAPPHAGSAAAEPHDFADIATLVTRIVARCEELRGQVARIGARMVKSELR